jgi:hypothetical protein
MAASVSEAPLLVGLAGERVGQEMKILSEGQNYHFLARLGCRFQT